jgi:uncharacterized protein YkwD
MTMAPRQGTTRWRRLAPIAAATLAITAAIAAGGAGPAQAAQCANANAAIDQASAKELQKALACVIDRERADRDRHKLDSNGKLEKAARRHNRTMLDQNCWAHKCNGEDGLEKRIRKTGYLKGAHKWKFAENFGCAATPKGMVGQWLESDFQRRNLLSPDYEDVGIAASKDQVSDPPSNCAADRVTYTAVFASRKG